MKYILLIIRVIYAFLIIGYMPVFFLMLYGMGGHAVPIGTILLGILISSIPYWAIVTIIHFIIKYLNKKYEED